MTLYEREESGAVRVNGGSHPSLPEQARQIQSEARALASSLEEVAADLRHAVAAELREHPYRTLAYAAVAGFVLGGGVATRLTRLALVTGGRLAFALAMQRLGTGVEQTLRQSIGGEASAPDVARVG